MKRLAIIVVLLVTLLVMSGIGYAFYQKKHGRINWAQEAVAAKLLDGESARFRNVGKIAEIGVFGKTEIGVCGEVNGKNRLSAYTGFKRFVVFGEPGDTAKVFIEDVYGSDPEISVSFIKCEQK